MTLLAWLSIRSGKSEENGFLFQHAALYDSLTVEQNVASPYNTINRKCRAPSRKIESDSCWRKWHARRFREDAFGYLAGGMQKRVGLARALALSRIFCFSTSPRWSRPISSAEIDDLILNFREHHMASIVVTHDLHSAKTIAGRLACSMRERCD